MRGNSAINTVHTARLEKKYSHVARHLRKWDRKGGNSYEGTVYKLDPRNHTIIFKTERLIPRKDRRRPRVLLLFSNPHPGSIKKGMFHSPDRRIANLWHDLRNAGLFVAEDDVLHCPDALRKHCLDVSYESPFAYAFACYWAFPTPYPSQLKVLFNSTMEPLGLTDPKVRLNRLLAKWRPKAIISFNGQVFEALTGTNTKGYTKRLHRGTLEGKYPAPGPEYRVFQTYPTGWRYDPHAPKLRQRSLERIARTIKGLR